MANEIHNYPLTATDINDSFFDVDQFNGLIYESKKVPTAVMNESIINNNSKGIYYSDLTQLALAINTPTKLKFATVVFEQGLTLSSASAITAATAGYYNLQFSAQINRISGGSSQNISIWFRKNNIDIPFSNTHLTVVANSGKLVGSWNFVEYLNAGDFISIMYSVSNLAIQILSEPADLVVPHPATPSVIVTINKI